MKAVFVLRVKGGHGEDHQVVIIKWMLVTTQIHPSGQHHLFP